MIIISGPSGAGKNAVIKGLLGEKNSPFIKPVTHTTRLPRDGEVNGVNYHFVNVATFLGMQSMDRFVETANVHGNLYGLTWGALEVATGRRKLPLLELDVQGATVVKSYYPKAFTVFIMPPDPWERVLRRRITERCAVSEMELERRMETALVEMGLAPEFDCVVDNEEGQLEQTILEVRRAIAMNFPSYFS